MVDRMDRLDRLRARNLVLHNCRLFRVIRVPSSYSPTTSPYIFVVVKQFLTQLSPNTHNMEPDAMEHLMKLINDMSAKIDQLQDEVRT